MSALQKSLHPDEKYKAGKLGGSLWKIGLAIAAVFMALSLLFGWREGDHWKRFLYAYVVGWSFIFSICVGVFWLILLHHLVRGRWATAVRRIAEAMTMAFPIVFISGLAFVLPVAFGYQDLYYWAHPDAALCLEKVGTTCHEYLHPSLVHKLGWLSGGFFLVRYIGYAVLYTGMAAYFARKSRQQDESGEDTCDCVSGREHSDLLDESDVSGREHFGSSAVLRAGGMETHRGGARTRSFARLGFGPGCLFGVPS